MTNATAQIVQFIEREKPQKTTKPKGPGIVFWKEFIYATPRRWLFGSSTNLKYFIENYEDRLIQSGALQRYKSSWYINVMVFDRVSREIVQEILPEGVSVTNESLMYSYYESGFAGQPAGAYISLHVAPHSAKYILAKQRREAMSKKKTTIDPMPSGTCLEDSASKSPEKLSSIALDKNRRVVDISSLDVTEQANALFSSRLIKLKPVQE